jgi:putative hydrolase of the HAD superfamily
MIFFDIDGTLIDHLGASAAASLALYDQFPGQIPFSRAAFPAAWESIMDRHFERYCSGEISLWDQRRARIRESFGCSDLGDADADARYYVFIREYEHLTRAYDDATPCLTELAGKRLGIISNGAREQQLAKLRRAGLLEYFTVMVFSEDTGFGKPHPSIFQEACRRAGDDPRGCIHIGDDLTNDIYASRALGIRPIWIDRNATVKNRVPASRITSLAELAKLLEENNVSSSGSRNSSETGAAHVGGTQV